MSIYAFDIDGTICNNTFGKYDDAVPIPDRIAYINYLFDNGHTIKMSQPEGALQTLIDSQNRQAIKKMGSWHHELIMGKPYADFYR